MAVSIGTSGLTFSDSTSQNTAGSTSFDKGRLISVTSYATAGTYTYTAPATCSKVLVKVTGAGGGSAGHFESGGAGGYSERLIIPFVAGATATVTVGGGGGGVGYYAAGGTGGTSSFGSYCSATGGYGANANYSHTGGIGGTGSGGQITLSGGGGLGHTNGFGAWGAKGTAGYWGGGFGTRHSGGEQIGTGAPGAGASGGTTSNAGSGKTANSGMVVVYAYS